MRVLVCGGRDFGNLNKGPDGNPIRDDEKAAQYRFVIDTIEKFAMENSKALAEGSWLPDDIEIISGAAKGADSVAIDWAVVNWCKCHIFPADWDKHGKAAGYIRNRQMLEEGKPDLVMAFPGGKGTAMMVDIAKKAGVPVKEIEWPSPYGTTSLSE